MRQLVSCCIKAGASGVAGAKAAASRGVDVCRTTPRFETAAAPYAWLNDVVAVGSAVRGPEAVILDFYTVT